MMTRSAARRVQETKSLCTPIIPTRHVPDLVEDARTGLLLPPRRLPPKYFYDATGSALFERICATPEYYPTRTEDALLQRHAADIIAATRPEQILELGSGSSRKTRRLFDACAALGHRCRYTPMDVCAAALEQAAAALAADYDWLEIAPLLGDYHAGLGNLPAAAGSSLFVFLGSTIGNFEAQDAEVFLREIRACMQPGDWLLLGADRVKDSALLQAAYNDADGVTAQFNLNLLQVLNRELRADFDSRRFAHRAIWNEGESRVEMYLQSLCDQVVRLGALQCSVSLRRDERILTELSHKYTPASLQRLLQAGGLQPLHHYQPDNRWFSLLLARRGD